MPLAGHVVFDLDGVIVDSEPTHERATDAYLAGLGATVDQRLRDDMMGRRVRELADAIAARLGRRPEEVLAEREAIFWHLLREGSGPEPMPSLRRALARLTDAGLPLAVATSGTRAYVEHVLERLGVRDAFKAVVSGEDVVHGKPHPEIYLRAAFLLGADPADCAAIEDTFHGVAAARAAGMRVVAVPNALTAAMDFSAADAVVADLRAAAAAILG
ncbi:MAG TPA: HAD family phosphatase [Actinomycetes bacterium]|jgi:sugar-phosphatase|nr:HAD family phosphatase [Actinomycetes bacterium]